MVGEPSGKRSNVFIGYFKRVEGSKKIGTDNVCGRTLGEFLEGNHAVRPDFVLPDLRAWQRAAYVITSQTDFTRSSTTDGSFIKGVSQFTFIRGSKGEEGNARG